MLGVGLADVRVDAKARVNAEEQLALAGFALRGGVVVVRGVQQRECEEERDAEQRHQRREPVLHDEPAEAHRKRALRQVLLDESLLRILVGHAHSPAPVAGICSGFGSSSNQFSPASVDRITFPPAPTIQHTLGVPQARSRK